MICKEKSVIAEQLKKTEENLRMAGEELLRMEGEGGTPLQQEQEAEANSCIAAGNAIKQERDVLKEQFRKT